MSIPHWAKGKGLVMIVKFWARSFETGAFRWQRSHFLT